MLFHHAASVSKLPCAYDLWPGLQSLVFCLTNFLRCCPNNSGNTLNGRSVYRGEVNATCIQFGSRREESPIRERGEFHHSLQNVCPAYWYATYAVPMTCATAVLCWWYSAPIYIVTDLCSIAVPRRTYSKCRRKGERQVWHVDSPSVTWSSITAVGAGHDAVHSLRQSAADICWIAAASGVFLPCLFLPSPLHS